MLNTYYTTRPYFKNKKNNALRKLFNNNIIGRYIFNYISQYENPM